MWPKEYGRVNVFWESHIGLGLRWSTMVYPLELSLSIPFVTLTVGLGRKVEK